MLLRLLLPKFRGDGGSEGTCNIDNLSKCFICIKPLAPYGPPGNLTTNVTSSTTANVSWTLLPYLKWYSFNITYHIWAKEHLRNGSFVNHTYIFQNDATNFELSDLHPYTNVTTNIQTCNIAGCSKYSHEVFQTVESSELMCFSFQFSSV